MNDIKQIKYLVFIKKLRSFISKLYYLQLYKLIIYLVVREQYKQAMVISKFLSPVEYVNFLFLFQLIYYHYLLLLLLILLS